MAGALLFSLWLRAGEPIGTDIGGETIVGRVLSDEVSPQSAPARYDLTIAVFTDYRCPSCRTSEQALGRAVAQDGRVRVIYKEWPALGEPSRRAAIVALAAARQGLYPQVRLMLMEASQIDDAGLQGIVTAAGGEWEAIERELPDPDERTGALLNEVAEQAFLLGLPGTPAYLAGPILVKGALTEEEFHRLFDRARAAER